MWGPVDLIPQRAVDTIEDSGVLPVLARAGDTSLGMAFAIADEALSGFDRTLVAATGGLELLYSIRGHKPGAMEHKLDWRHTLGIGPALDQLLSCRLMLAVLKGAPLHLSPPEDREALMISSAAEHDFSDDDIADLKVHESFLALVCELQAWLGRPLEPPARPDEDDAAELGRALALIRQPQRGGSWSEVNVVIAQDPPMDAFQVAVLEPVYATLFRSRIYLGIDLISLRAARIAERDGQSARLVPAGNDDVLVTLQHPDAAPAEAARPVDVEGFGRVLVRSLPEAG
jgi:hypothetical protein